MKKVQLITNSIIVSILISLIVVAVPFSTQVKTSTNPNIIYSGNTSQNKVCFMINVYWGTEYLEDMLDILDLYNVKTTFFVGGSWFAKNIDIAKTVAKICHSLCFYVNSSLPNLCFVIKLKW